MNTSDTPKELLAPTSPNSPVGTDADRPQGKYKEIGYAYPTSPMAVHCGHAKTGCYFVLVTTLGSKVQAFPTWQQAKDYADTLPQEYTRYSMDGKGSCEALDAVRAAR